MLQRFSPSNKIAQLAIMLYLLDAIYSQGKNESESQVTPIYTKLYLITQLYFFTEMDSCVDVFLINWEVFEKGLTENTPKYEC